ncbi:hypothetical protein C8J56DRAFT_903304 [Mycena floridula]|nr:hypothetical protein C8J56DRAFT_903304 [Mycena floridula]
MGSGEHRSSKKQCDSSIAGVQDFAFLRSPTASELVVTDGYRIHVAAYEGKVMVLKIYEGAGSKDLTDPQRLVADLNLNQYPRHPTVLGVVASCNTVQRPFIVLDIGPANPSTHSSLEGIKNLSCYLAPALSKKESDSLLVGAKLAGLDHLESIEQGFSLSKLMVMCTISPEIFPFDLIVDAANNICISVGMENGSTTPMLNIRASKILFQVDKSGLLDDGRSDLTVLSVPLRRQSDRVAPRRDYVFIPELTFSDVSVRQISKDYTKFISRLAVSINLFRQNAPSPGNVHHRCPGYERQEAAIGTLTAIDKITSPGI